MNKSRLEAFSDSVIAIIITIIVLMIDIPEGDDWTALSKVLPLFFCYAVSFLLIGMRWANHHHLLQITQAVNGKIIWANLLYLFSLSLYPVSTSWVARTLFAPASTTVITALNLFETLSFVVLEHSIISSHDCLMIKKRCQKKQKGNCHACFGSRRCCRFFHSADSSRLVYITADNVRPLDCSRFEDEKSLSKYKSNIK